MSVLFLAACDQATVPPTAAVPPPPAPPPVLAPAPDAQAAASVDEYSRKALELFKDGRNLAAQYTDQAKKTLEKLDLTPLKDKASSLLAALEKKDFATAEKAAKDVDTNLDSDVVSRSVGFLQIEARDGVAAAAKAVDNYLQDPNLSAAQKEYFLRFKEGLYDPRTKKGVELACHALVLGCDLKYGHEGSAVVAAVVGMLFDEKQGVFKDYGILRQPTSAPAATPPAQ